MDDYVPEEQENVEGVVADGAPVKRRYKAVHRDKLREEMIYWDQHEAPKEFRFPTLKAMHDFFVKRLGFYVAKETVESVIGGIGPRSGCTRTSDKYDWIQKPRTVEESLASSSQDASAMARKMDDVLVRVAAIEGREGDLESLVKQLLARCEAMEKVTVKLQQQLFEHVTVQHAQPRQSELNFGS